MKHEFRARLAPGMQRGVAAELVTDIGGVAAGRGLIELHVIDNFGHFGGAQRIRMGDGGKGGECRDEEETGVHGG